MTSTRRSNLARFVWPIPEPEINNCQGNVSDSELKEGKFTAAGDFPGLGGDYYLMTDEMSFAFDPEDHIDTFVHETWTVDIEKWLTVVDDKNPEPVAIDKTRDSLTNVVEARVKNNPGSFQFSAVVTSTDHTPRQTNIVGRCLVARPT